MLKEFDDKYNQDETVVSKETGDLGRLETYGKDYLDLIQIDVKTPKKVWTVVDTDEGVHIMAGLHFVNRIFYVITEKEWTSSEETYKY